MVVGGESISDLAKAWNIKGWGTAWLYGIYNTDTPRPGFRLFDAFQVTLPPSSGFCWLNFDSKPYLTLFRDDIKSMEHVWLDQWLLSAWFFLHRSNLAKVIRKVFSTSGGQLHVPSVKSRSGDAMAKKAIRIRLRYIWNSSGYQIQDSLAQTEFILGRYAQE